jgi:hypothetical protein
VFANVAQTGFALAAYNKVNFGTVQFNDNGAWDVASGKYICLRSGRLQFGASLLILNGSGGRNDYQLVVRVDDASNNLLTRFQLSYQFIPNSGEEVGYHGTKLYPVEVSWKLYPDKIVGGSGTGASIFPNGGVIYNQFHCYYVD